MRFRAASSAVVVLFQAAGLLTVAACVPRPASLGTPTVTGAGEPSPVNRASATTGATAVGNTPIPSFVRPTPLPAPTFMAYTVRSGDTLTSIAREFHTTPRSIAFWSRGEHPSLDPESTAYRPDRLDVGWTLLVIPDAVFDENELLDTPSPSTEVPQSPGSSPTAG